MEKLRSPDGSQSYTEAEAQQLPPSQQAGLWRENAKGEREYPFAEPEPGVFFLGDYADQKPVMGRIELADAGLTDSKLEAMRLELFGKEPKGVLVLDDDVTDTRELMERRRQVYDDVMRALYG